MATRKGSDLFAVVATVDPDAGSTGAFNSDWVAVKNFEAVSAILMAGIINANGTLDFKIQEAKSSTGESSQDLTGKSITQFTTSDNDKQAVIDVAAEDLSDDYTHVRAVLTAATTGSDHAALVIGLLPRSGLGAYSNDLASVAEIV